MPIGIIANTAAALGISIASHIDGLAGKKLKDMDGRVHIVSSVKDQIIVQNTL
ncbi:hypothetical protein SH2C18_50120 [Clostridium sediminicola]|uniref:DUF2000 family protein n=1 Tax=Clostridium sediminicola TaxID=3114879 RepID=UPI0031F1CE02